MHTIPWSLELGASRSLSLSTLRYFCVVGILGTYVGILMFPIIIKIIVKIAIYVRDEKHAWVTAVPLWTLWFKTSPMCKKKKEKSNWPWLFTMHRMCGKCKIRNMCSALAA